jgi:hypothetical protein
MMEILPENLISVYQYIMSLEYDDKLDYQLIKLWMATCEDDEKQAFGSAHVINNLE